MVASFEQDTTVRLSHEVHPAGEVSSELTEGLPGAFSGLTEDDLMAIAGTARYNLGC